jgi:hypothetical protein
MAPRSDTLTGMHRGVETGDFYNISITVVAAASAASNTLSLAEQSARGGDVRSAVIALYVAQETIIAAAAALQKDYSAVVFHTKQVPPYGCISSP